MPEPVSLKAHRSKGDADENEKMAKTFEDAAVRARRGEFKSVCWCAYGRKDYAALFGWHKFGTMVPLIGAVNLMLSEMCSSPIMPLTELEDVDAVEVEEAGEVHAGRGPQSEVCEGGGDQPEGR